MLRRQFIIVVLGMAMTASAKAADRDCDGLNDALEQDLLDRHRPILFWEAAEHYWPISAEDFVRGSRLIRGIGDSAIEIYSQAQLAADPLLALRAADVVPGYSSTTLESTCRSDYHLDLNDSLRDGTYPQADGSAHVGMYGHVVPHEDGHIIVQYWQLLGYNEARQDSIFADCGTDIGDHEGDWLRLDVHVAASTFEVLRFEHFHHGSICPATVTANPSSAIPVCYLEGDAHEWWPFPGECECYFDPLEAISKR
jgi:hypothetical protein